MISQPESYGLTAAETLAFTGTGAAPPEGFEAFWQTFRDEIAVLSTRLPFATLEPGEPSEGVVESIRSKRIAISMMLPRTTAVRGCIVTSHGAEGVPDTFVHDGIEPWLETGYAVLQVRVRGYPPSTIDVSDCRSEWIRKDIHDPEAWILRGGIADVALACRLARTWLGDDRPITLHGRSLGGGLAVIAAAQLEFLGQPIQRLCVALPSLGCWDWRFDRYCNGFGAMVNQEVDVLRGEDRTRLKESIRLFDACMHAKEISVPQVLGQLAFRDDHVPAPTAAAIFNAISSCDKHAVHTTWGHFEGGIAHARKHLLWQDLEARFVSGSIDGGDLIEGVQLISDDPDQEEVGWNSPSKSGGE